MEQKKKINKKVSAICLMLGVLFIAGCIALIVLHCAKFEVYNAAYEEWYEAWWNGMADFNDAPAIPSSVLMMLGVFSGFIGLALTLTGLTPYIGKLRAKLVKETLDYAGDDISKASVKGVQVAKPAIEELGKVIKPIITNETAEEKEEGSENNFCPYCGAKLKGGYEFCPKCGKNI